MSHFQHIFNQLTCLPALFTVAGGSIILYHTAILLRILYKLKRVKDYACFVRRHYTKNGKQTPALILRIQNSYIRDYNQALNALIAKLLRLKKIPFYRPPENSDQAKSSMKNS